MEINGPLTHGFATDVLCRFVPHIVLAVRQENHDGCPTIHISWWIYYWTKHCISNDAYRSVSQCVVMTFCALSSALVKSVPPSGSNCKAAVSNCSGELVKSFSMEVDGSWLKKTRLYASLLPPPTGELWSTAAWRAIQKL